MKIYVFKSKVVTVLHIAEIHVIKIDGSVQDLVVRIGIFVSDIDLFIDDLEYPL